tara:strand:+ start:26506 stop:27246 length:741 start_codon:yes stop_codon:yes gene_type:complete
MPCPTANLPLSVNQLVYLLNQYPSDQIAIAAGILQGLVSTIPTVPTQPEPPEFELPPITSPTALVNSLLSLTRSELDLVISEVLENKLLKALEETPESIKSILTSQANQTTASLKITAVRVIRKKFGISLHSNMDLRSIVNEWTARVGVCPEVATDCPILATTMAVATATIMAQDAVILAQNIADQLMTAAELVALLGSSGVTGFGGPLIAAEATQAAAMIAQEAQTIIIEQATVQMLALIENVPC